jgi:hypothetical protein
MEDEPIHCYAARSASLHLFQRLSTLGQQLAHALSLRQGLSGVESVFPARPPRARQPFGGTQSGAGNAFACDMSYWPLQENGRVCLDGSWLPRSSTALRSSAKGQISGDGTPCTEAARISPLPSVSRVPNFGSTARAHACASPGLRQSRVHVSSANAGNALVLPRFTVPYWRRCAWGIGWPLPATDTSSLVGSVVGVIDFAERATQASSLAHSSTGITEEI